MHCFVNGLHYILFKKLGHLSYWFCNPIHILRSSTWSVIQVARIFPKCIRYILLHVFWHTEVLNFHDHQTLNLFLCNFFYSSKSEWEPYLIVIWYFQSTRRYFLVSKKSVNRHFQLVSKALKLVHFLELSLSKQWELPQIFTYSSAFYRNKTKPNLEILNVQNLKTGKSKWWHVYNLGKYSLIKKI